MGASSTIVTGEYENMKTKVTVTETETFIQSQTQILLVPSYCHFPL